MLGGGGACAYTARGTAMCSPLGFQLIVHAGHARAGSAMCRGGGACLALQAAQLPPPLVIFNFNVHAGRVHAPLTAMPVCLQACAARGGDQRCGRSRITLHAAQLPPPLFIKRLTCAQEICTRRLCGDACVLASLRRLLRRLEGEQHECVHSLL